MSVDTFTATTNLQPIYPSGYQDTLTVFNKDATANLYLTDRPGVDPKSGWLVSPQSTVTWVAERPLYVATDAVAGSQFQLIDQSMNGWNPSAIASQLISQQLPQLIAQQISIQGAPPLNAYDVLQNVNNSGVIPAANFYTVDTNVSKYNTVRYNVVYPCIGASVSTPSIRPIKFLWYTGDPSLGTSVLIDSEIYYTYHCISINRLGTAIFAPVRGAWLRIQIFPEINGISPSGGFFQWSLIGSYQTIDTPVQFMGFYAFGSSSAWTVDANNNQDNVWTAFGAKAGGVALLDYPPIQSGPCFMTVVCNPVTLGTLQISLQECINNRLVATLWFASGAPASTDKVEFIAPNRPCFLNIGGTAAASNFVSVSVSSQPR